MTTIAKRLVDEYQATLNDTKAAIAAGYSSKTAKSQAARLLTNMNLQAALERGNADRQQRTGVTPERVLRDIDTAANLDVAELFDVQKQLKSGRGAAGPERARVRVHRYGRHPWAMRARR